MGTLLAEAIVAGIGIGSIYGIIAMGYTLILGASGVFNFAQGSAVMGGALVSYALGTVEHLPLLIILGIVMAIGAFTGLVIHTIAVLPLTYRTGVTNLTFGTFLSTLGLALVLNSIISLGFGDANIDPVNYYVSQNPIHLLGLNIRPIYAVMFLTTLALVAIFEFISRTTSAGLVMRAVFNDNEGAALAGISIARAVRSVFILGCLLAAIAGFLVAPISFAQTNIANQYAFFGFAAMAIGGYGSFAGAIIGGLIVGLVGEVPLIWVNPEISGALIYGTLLLVLLVRPQGLFGSGGSTFGAAGLRDV
jgi:branched-subunit amino acid ABC-type transport system permease component